MKDGFVKIAAGMPAIKVADPKHNCNAAVGVAVKAAREGAHILVLPELCLTGYSCGDLFFQELLIEGAREALLELAEGTRSLNMLIFAGLPFRYGAGLYNCATAVFGGQVLAIIPKTFVKGSRGGSELRYFSPAPEKNGSVLVGSEEVSFGTNILLRCNALPELCVACEIGEDLMAPTSPSVSHCAAGANVIVNPFAAPEIVGAEEHKRALIKAQSAKLTCVYAMACAGEGESTTDGVFSGHGIICESGRIVAEAEPFSDRDLIIQAADLQHLSYDRRAGGAYEIKDEGYTAVKLPLKYEAVSLEREETAGIADLVMSPFMGYFADPTPFIPHDENEKRERFAKILEIQTRGLAARYTAARSNGFVIGISGGLDSCLAMIVAVRAADRLGLDRECIEAVTMPCFGTSERTRRNADELCRLLGVRLRSVEIAEAVNIHFRDIGHDPDDYNVVYENAQARERTQILFDIANETGALVIGTGDLSELALGFATYNGDHMSSYGVNADIPKTLVRCLVRYYAETALEAGEVRLSQILLDIVNTPVSPELLPPDENGDIGQKTEELVGPYELHDFYLFRMLRYGERPEKIYRMARLAFEGIYAPDEIRRWMRVFYSRFFTQQFKRSCLPDGPAVGSVALSPRGAWCMPSDAVARLWLKEIEEL